MGLIQDYLRKMKEKKEEKNAYARGEYIKEEFERKKLSSNERELMRYKEEERQKRIKAALERYRKTENDKIWKGKQDNPVYAKNFIAGQKLLFNGKNTIKDADNFFDGTGNIFNKKDMFFKGGKR